MYVMDAPYSDAIKAHDRKVTMYASIGVGVDLTAADDLSGIEGDFLPMSNTAQVIDAIYKPTPGMAVFEGDGIETSADNGLTAPPIVPTANPPEVGIWSAGISDEYGNIEVGIDLTLAAEHTSAFRVYTHGPNVTSADLVFTLSDGTEQTVECECYGGYFSIPKVLTYTGIKILVHSIDRPYHHLRRVEVEFGSAITFSSAIIAGEVVHIRELDPLETAIPLDELDLTLVNVDGAFDVDNPATRLGELSIGYPLTLSYSVDVPDGMMTVPCGRYYVGTLEARDTRLSVAAFDARWILSQEFSSWSISTTESLGDMYDRILTEHSVPHIVDTDLFSVFPSSSYTFADDMSVLDGLLWVQQAYGVYMVPDRDETVHVTRTFPSGDAGAVDPDSVYQWPLPKQSSKYNYIQVGYAATPDSESQYVVRDMRKDSGESKSSIQIIGNPLITTSAIATALVDRIAARIPSMEVETDWIGDPAIDVGDTLAIPGRWTQANPATYQVTYIESTFDGSYSEVMRAVR